MKGFKSVFSVVLAGLSIALGFFAELVMHRAERLRAAVVDVAGALWRGVASFGAKVFSGPAVLSEVREVVERGRLVASEQYRNRQCKRERPVIQRQWRMCPSV
jgi:hypothetical protein